MACLISLPLICGFADFLHSAVQEIEAAGLIGQAADLKTCCVSMTSLNDFMAILASIGEMSLATQCPPVLLYCALTPLWSKTAMKLRLLRLEKEVTFLSQGGWSVRKIARHLKRPERVIREHCDEQFSEAVYLQRSWYNDRAPRPRDPDELIYDEKTLPPTTRLGWQNGQLLDIPEERKGRCPTCGHIVSLPCLACRLRRDMELKKIAPAEEFDPADEEGDIEPDLLFL